MQKRKNKDLLQAISKTKLFKIEFLLKKEKERKVAAIHIRQFRRMGTGNAIFLSLKISQLKLFNVFSKKNENVEITGANYHSKMSKVPA